MPTVYSYLRFSRPEQLRGDSQRRQLERSKTWAEKNGYVLDENLCLQDLGVSAFRGKNATQGELGAFLEAVQAGKVKPGSVLVVESLDRLSRQEIDDAYQRFRSILLAGVDVHTLEPEEHFTKADLNNPFKFIITITIMARAHEESATKSKRLKAAWGNKRNKAAENKLTSIAPKWLRLAEDRKRFEIIPERAEVVQRMFRMAADGLGMNAIAKRLNGERVKTFGKADFWHVSYVKKILANRSVLGEYQPHRMEGGKRVPSGEPLPNYFPAIVDERDFYAVQRGKEERRGQHGRHGKRMANLFTGLVRDARDGSPMSIVDKGNGPSLVSSAARQGVRGSVYVSFPYAAFEQALLVWGHDLKLGEVLPRKGTNLDEEIKKAEGRAADLEHRIRTLKDRMKTAGNFDALMELLIELEQERTEAKEKAERLKRENATQEGEALDRTRELIERLGHATEEEAYAIRTKLRATLRRLVSDVAVLVVQVNGDRAALVDIALRSGIRRRLTVMAGKRVVLPEELGGADIRKWKEWPKSLRKVRFDAMREEALEMIELEREGLSRTEIAERLGVSKTHVSRTLVRLGERKQAKKPANDERVMNWHPGGRGWTKTFQGQRYFIGAGKLAALYPKMVKGRDAEGTWKAANEWWKAKRKELENIPAGSSK